MRRLNVSLSDRALSFMEKVLKSDVSALPWLVVCVILFIETYVIMGLVERIFSK
jgi:hypothetical protein